MPTIAPLLSWLLTGTLLLGAWYGCYHLALRRERSFGYNRAFLVAGPLLAAGLPLLPTGWAAALPVWLGGGEGSANALPRLAAVLLPAVQAGPPAAGAVDWRFGLTIVYVLGVALGLARLALGLGRLWWQARQLPAEPHPGYTLRRTSGRLPTSSFGRVVFWDDTLPLTPAEAAQVLRHELAHVRQRHTLDRLLLEALRAVLWPNPFVHLCGRALTLTHEFLADAAALGTQPVAAAPPLPVSAYACLLARQAAAVSGFSVPLAHPFSHSQTLTRIAMLHIPPTRHRWKKALALPLLTLLIGTVAHSQSSPPQPKAPPAPPVAPPPPPKAPPAPPVAPPPKAAVEPAAPSQYWELFPKKEGC